MNPNKWTTKAQEAFETARSLAGTLSHQALEPDHLLAAMLDQKDGVVPAILQKLNVPVDSFSRDVRRVLGKKPKVSGGEPYVSRELIELIDAAEALARQLQDDFTSTEHFLLAL